MIIRYLDPQGLVALQIAQPIGYYTEPATPEKRPLHNYLRCSSCSCSSFDCGDDDDDGERILFS